MKDKSSKENMVSFVVLRPIMYSCLTDDTFFDKKTKGTRKSVIKPEIRFQDYKNCLEANRLENEMNFSEKNNIDLDKLEMNHIEILKDAILIVISQQHFKSEAHNVFSQEVHKTELNSNND